MQIPRKLIDDYTATLNAFSDSAKSMLSEMLERIDYSDIAAARDAIIEAFETVAAEYSAYVGYSAEEFYFAVREIELGEMGAAYSTYSRNSAATDGAIRAFMQEAVDGNAEKVPGLVLQRMDYELAKYAAETVLSMGQKEKRRVRYARVPSGSETCKFCLMLASRGFVYRSEMSAGSDHYHANCDCRIVPNFGKADIAGYDPDALYRQWKDGINEEAKARAEKNGTNEKDEYRKIMDSLSNSAKRSKKRRREERARSKSNQ